jgi:hypothetical protein
MRNELKKFMRRHLAQIVRKAVKNMEAVEENVQNQKDER